MQRNKRIEAIRESWLQKKTHLGTQPFKKDEMPHVKNSNTEDRFEMFKWLLQFFVDVEGIQNTPFVDPNEARDMKARTAKVRRAVFQGLQYLLNMGRVVPASKMKQDNYLITLLRGVKGMDKEFETHYSVTTGSVHGSQKNKCILQVFGRRNMSIGVPWK